MYCDMDEIIIPEPNLYTDLTDFMKRCRQQQTICEGYEIIKDGESEETINFTKPILNQRRLMCRDRSGSYNKPALSRIATDWAEGFHFIKGWEGDDVRKIANTGLYMFHVKHINDTDCPKHCKYTDENRQEICNKLEIPDKFKGKF